MSSEKREISKENDSHVDDDVFIIAVTCFCVIGLLVICVVVFCTWWCYVNRKERQSLFRKARRKEHLKYLEEYSVRTDDDEESPKISPRSIPSTGNGSCKNGYDNPNDSGFDIDEWAHHRGDQSSSLEVSNGSSALYRIRHNSDKQNDSDLSSGYSNNNIDSELGTNIDDVKL